MSDGSEEIINAADEKLIEWILESKAKSVVRACEAELQRRIMLQLAAINQHLAQSGNG